MTRREARVAAMQIIYNNDFYGTSLAESLSFFEYEDKEKVSSFLNLLEGKLDEIDSIISSCLENYTIERLNQVDKAIIRLATAELLAGTTKAIVINEALEITREYSDQGDNKAVRFNNKLLDRIVKKLSLQTSFFVI